MEIDMVQVIVKEPTAPKNEYSFEQLNNGDLVRDGLGYYYIAVRYGWDETRHGLYCLKDMRGAFSGVFCDVRNLKDLKYEKLSKEMTITLFN